MTRVSVAIHSVGHDHDADQQPAPHRPAGARRPAPLPPRHATQGGRRWRRLQWPLATGWLLVAVALTPLAGRLGGIVHDTPASSLPSGSQSTRVAQLQADSDGGRAVVDEVLVFRRADRPLDRADRAAVQSRRAAVAALRSPGVGAPGPVTLSRDGRAATVTVPITPRSATDADTVTGAVAAARGVARRALGRGLTAYVTGAAGIAADTATGSVDSTLLLSSGLIVAVLLLVTYRSLLLWLVPLTAAGVATQVARAGAYGLGRAGLTVTTLASSVLVVLVFGAATDYALLLVNRYRQELGRYEDHHDALAVAWRRTLPALLASAGTVTVALLCLLLARLGGVRGLGPVGAVGIVSALAVQLSFLPAVLAIAGRRILWPRVARPGQAAPHRRTIWDRLNGVVGGRPLAVLTTSLLLLAVLATGLRGLHGTQDPLDQIKGNPDSAVGARLLAVHFADVYSAPVDILLPVGASATTVAGVAAVARTTGGVSGVSATAPVGRRPALSAQLSVDPYGPSAGRVVTRLRSRLASRPGVLVGGEPAVDADYRAASHRDIAVLLPAMLLAVGLVLLVLLRSLAAPLLLLGSVALSFAASWGAGVWVFSHVLGFHGVEDDLTIYVFLFLVALGVDYTIFLMERVQEARASTDTRTAMREALAGTGGVITAAAFVLAGTFTTLAQLPSVALAQVGTAVAGGILLDALVVRSLLVPAAVHLLGDRIWWPRHPRDARPGPRTAPGDQGLRVTDGGPVLT